MNAGFYLLSVPRSDSQSPALILSKKHQFREENRKNRKSLHELFIDTAQSPFQTKRQIFAVKHGKYGNFHRFRLDLIAIPLF